jgi:hypothetical protein
MRKTSPTASPNLSHDSLGSARSHTASKLREPSEQIHLRLAPPDATLLRRMAAARGQTLSGAVAYLVRTIARGHGN